MVCRIEEVSIKEKSLLSSFTSFLSDRALEIGKFGRVSKDLGQYLADYDFAKGFDFEAKKKAIQQLHPLRLKLVRMGDAAKKLSGYPDRYGSKKAIETCKRLALTCLDRMSLDESEKVSALCESNTKKLEDLQTLLERDETIYNQIKAIVKKDASVLLKYNAFRSEVERYIGEFPHSGQDDLEVVKSRINVIKELDVLSTKADKAVSAIKDFCDRHNKNSLVSRYTDTIAKMSSSMLFAETERYKNVLKDIEKNAIGVLNEFNNEPHELEMIKSSMNKKQKAFWREDYEMLLTIIDDLLKHDTNKKNFNITQLKAQVDNKQQKRTRDIEETKKLYPWIEKNKYREIHSELTNRHIKYSTYKANIERLCGYRQTRIVLGFIPVLGWIILFCMGGFRINWSL